MTKWRTIATTLHGRGAHVADKAVKLSAIGNRCRVRLPSDGLHLSLSAELSVNSDPERFTQQIHLNKIYFTHAPRHKSRKPQQVLSGGAQFRTG